MKTVGVIAGLSFFYVLVSPSGTRAVDAASGGLTHAARSLISPTVDPLRPSTGKTVARRAAPQLPASRKPATNLTLPGVNHSVPGHAY